MPRLFSIALLLSAQVTAAQVPSNAIKIRDSVYMAPVTGNVYLVTTPAGNVVIDTATAAMAADAKQLLTPKIKGP